MTLLYYSQTDFPVGSHLPQIDIRTGVAEESRLASYGQQVTYVGSRQVAPQICSGILRKDIPFPLPIRRWASNCLIGLLS